MLFPQGCEGVLMRWIAIILLCAASATAADTKPWPAASEPDWNSWTMPNKEVGLKVQEAWKILRKHAPDEKFEKPEDAAAANKEMDDAYAVLEEHTEAACAVGAYYLKRVQADWERIVIGGVLFGLDEKKGKPFLIWALAKSGPVDDLFAGVFEDACYIAETPSAADLPGLFWILKTRKGAVYLPEHNWIIPTHDCLFYVYGRIGHGIVPYLRTALKDQDPYVKRNAAVLLGYFLDYESRDELLAMLQAGGVPSLGAAFALGEMGDQKALPYLVRMLQHQDATFRQWAIYAIFEIKDKRTLPMLKEALAKESEEHVKKELTAAIKHIESDDPGVQPLTPEELKKILAEAEANGGQILKPDAVQASVNREHYVQLVRIRKKAIESLTGPGHTGFRQWHKVLKAAVRNPGQTVR